MFVCLHNNFILNIILHFWQLIVTMIMHNYMHNIHKLNKIVVPQNNMCAYIQNTRCVLHYNMFSRRRFLFNIKQKVRPHCPALSTIIYTRLLLKWFLLYIISDVRHSILIFEVSFFYLIISVKFSPFNMHFFE